MTTDASPRIIQAPAILSGKPIIRGTRLSVEYVLSLLRSGATTGEILAEYDGLTPDDIAACIAWAPRTWD